MTFIITLGLKIIAVLALVGGLIQGYVALREMIAHHMPLGKKKKQLFILLWFLIAGISLYGAYNPSLLELSSSSPAPSLTAASNLSPFPNPTPSTVPAGTVLYNADWSKGADNWAVSNEWSTNGGMLVNDGSTTGNGILLAPPFQSPSANYSVDARIQFLKSTGLYGSYAFGIIVRSSGGSDGYACYLVNEYNVSASIAKVPSESSAYSPFIFGASSLQSYLHPVDTDWHTYRVEVSGSEIDFFIDTFTQPLLKVINSDYPSGTVVGLVDNTSVINVNYFRVTAL